MSASNGGGRAVAAWVPKVARDAIEYEIDSRDDVENMSEIVGEAVLERYNLSHRR